MYKNAGIKNIREAITRLMDGEVFYMSQGYKRIYFEENKYSSPFKVDTECVGQECLTGSFADFQEWQIKTDWRDNLSEENPVLCWVWNDNNRKRVVAVEEFDNKDKSYYANRHWYAHAVPLTKEEALKYIIEE